jgi:hypothetical protein
MNDYLPKSLEDERIEAASNLRAEMMGRATRAAHQPRWHRGDWMQTYTGRKFYPLAPRPEDIHPRDIAHALSLLCRYNGHVDRFYSVAEHCVLMSRAVAPEHALAALLHDATEAYVGDMIRPLKQSMPDYVRAEDLVMVQIARRFALPLHTLGYSMPTEVKDADNRILLTERAALMSAVAPGRWGVDGLEPLDVTIHGWEPIDAECQYLARLSELGWRATSEKANS